MNTFLRRHARWFAAAASLVIVLSLTQSAAVFQRVFSERSVNSTPLQVRETNSYCTQLDYVGMPDQPFSIEMACFEESVTITILPWKMNQGVDYYGIQVEDVALRDDVLAVLYVVFDGQETLVCRLDRVISGPRAQPAEQTIDSGCEPFEYPELDMPPGTIRAEWAYADLAHNV